MQPWQQFGHDNGIHGVGALETGDACQATAGEVSNDGISVPEASEQVREVLQDLPLDGSGCLVYKIVVRI